MSRLSLSLLALVMACGPKAPPAPPVVASSPAAEAAPPAAPPIVIQPGLELGETVPIETTLDDPDIAEAHEIWAELFEGAKTRIDLEQFYVSPRPEGPGRLRPLIASLETAAGRGVAVRMLADAKFAKTYPDTLAALGDVEGIEVRLIDMKPVRGGVQHAKFFRVDDAVWLGSQNFDWRSLEHIHELGVTVREPRAAADLGAVFEQDWAIAGGGEVPPRGEPAVDEDGPTPTPYRGGTVKIEAVASPADLLPPGVDWDLPHLLRMIEGAETRVRVQLLNHAIVGYDKQSWPVLDQALRDAAGRGVTVEMMVSDWSKRGHKLAVAKDLARVDGITVKFVAIPDWSGGFVDFSRTIHSKYMTVDGQHGWLGTSNWSRDYFHSSRNVGVVVDGALFADDLDRVFQRIWDSDYAETVDPEASYTPRKVR
jgi:phosphatidylserine/phosphatidylglycerophosphate/cardiolipin synthase-like enzyme